MAQANINYGAFPDDPVANTIRDAFIATQTNFDQLFAGAAANANVAQIVAGNGISISPANGVGNVTVNNIFNSLRVRSNTLSVTALGGTLDGDTSVISNASSTLVLEINSNTNANSSLYNLEVANDFSVFGNTVTIPNATATFGNGNIILDSGKIFGNVQAHGGTGAIQYSDTNATMAGSSVFYFDSAMGTMHVPEIITTAVTAALITSSSANLDDLVGNTANVTSITANSIAANSGSFAANITADTVVANLAGNLVNAAWANAVVFYDATGKSKGNATFTFDGANLTLSNGTVAATGFIGNLSGSASDAVNVTGPIQNNITQVGNLNLLNVFGNTVVGGLISNTHVQGANATFTDQLVGNTLTTTNFEASRANVQFGIVCNNLTANTNVLATDVTASAISATSNVTTLLLKFTPQISDPVAPTGGDVYYNAATGKLRVYNATLPGWQDLN